MRDIGASDETRQPGFRAGTPGQVALVGSYVPRKCGIATFTRDLREALLAASPGISPRVVALNDRADGYAYPEEVCFEINQNRLDDYGLAADFLNMQQLDAVCLQHEYGIFGGKSGSYITEFLHELKMPVVTTLHTVLKDPKPAERQVMRQIVERSDRIVVMSHRACDFMRDIYRTPADKLVLIPHGIPDVRLEDPAIHKPTFGLEDRQVILTFGLISPGKGLEYMVDALAEIIVKHPDAVYVILGNTHPNLKAREGEAYRDELRRRAVERGVDRHIRFDDRFLPLSDLLEYMKAADVYVTPYPNKAQIVSGTLAYALGVGKAVVSTPYWHAQEMLADGRGMLVPFKDSAALAERVGFLLDHEAERRAMALEAYAYCRDMVWESVGAKYSRTFEAAAAEPRRRALPAFGASKLETSPLPDVKLDHLKVLTDGTGMLQHATFTVPNRDHGYCVDDNARALIVTTLAQFLPSPCVTANPEVSLDQLAAIYLSFLDHAFSGRTGRFRNFMSYDRRWLGDAGSEDAHGRAVWALGVTVGGTRNKGHLAAALNLFHKALGAVESFASPRAFAFSLIGMNAYLERYYGDSRVRRLLESAANKLKAFYDQAPDRRWVWPEETLTYDNARIPQALILSGRRLGNEAMLSTGLRSLAWLKDLQTCAERGVFMPVGNRGWFPKSGTMARFDQQPLEAAAMVDACLAAFDASQEEDWNACAHKCLHWFLGKNDQHETLYDAKHGGCRDGLEPNGVNENQGAESTLSWLLALLALYIHRDKGTPPTHVGQWERIQETTVKLK